VPRRHTRREDLRPSLRTTSYRSRVTIAYHITDTQQIIDRVLCGGWNLPVLFSEDNKGNT